MKSAFGISAVVLLCIGVTGVYDASAPVAIAAAQSQKKTKESNAKKDPTDGKTLEIYVPDNPVAAEYVLGRLSNKELVRVRRRESVYIALLVRKGLNIKYRHEALQGLAKIKKTDELTQLVEGLKRIDSNEEEGQDSSVPLKLAGILTASKTADLVKMRDAFETMAAGSKRPVIRQIGYLGLIRADKSADKAWQFASGSNDRLSDLLGSLSMISNAKVLASLYPKVQPLLDKAPSDEVRKAAISAITYIPGHDTQSFTALAGFVKQGTEPDASIRALQRIARSGWPKDQIQPLAENIVNYVESVPPDRRTHPEIKNAIAWGNELATLLPAKAAHQIRSALEDLGVIVLRLRTVKHEMMYDKKEFFVQAGKPVEIILVNDDLMPHNLVITQPGAMVEIGLAADKMSEGFIPQTKKILFHTKLVEPDQSATLSFIAPKKPGVYPYICTFPNHWVRMFGALYVLEDLKQYRANPKAYLVAHPMKIKDKPLGRKFVKDWKVEDLVDSLPRVARGRSFENGQLMFMVATCYSCHQIQGAGGNVGPDLTSLDKKRFQQRVDLLRDIIESSFRIHEKFVTHNIFNEETGITISGIIVSQDDEVIRVMRNPSNKHDLTEIPRDQIEEGGIRKSKLSMMPQKLLNMLHEEEILDLLAYIESGGDPNYKAFKK